MIVKADSIDLLCKSSVVGILTERDIVYALSGGNKSLQSKTVFDVMTKKLIYTCPETSNSEAKQLMLENQIRHLPVFSDEHLVGIISMRDVFRSWFNFFHMTFFQRLSYAALNFPTSAAGMPIFIFILPYYAGDLGLGLSLVGIIFFLGRITDIFTDPIMGVLIDKFPSKY